MKWFFWALAALTLILLTTLITIWLAPQLLLSAVNSSTRFNTNAESIEISYFPPSVKLENLAISTADLRFAEFETLETTSTWRTLFERSAPLAKIRANNGEVNLNNIEGLSDNESTNNSAQQLNLFALANSVRLEAKNVLIKIDEASSVDLVHLNNSLNTSNDETSTLTINTNAKYTNGPSSLFIDGITFLENQNNSDRINIKLDKLDLSSISEQQNDQAAEDTDIDVKQAEADLDWTWMNSLRNCQLDVEIGEVRFSQGTIDNFIANIEIADSVRLSAQGKLDLSLDKDNFINELVSIEAELTPIAKSTDAADVNGSVVVISETGELSADGQFNLNGLDAMSANINLALNTLPSGLDVDIKQLQQYLPLNVSGQAITQDASISIDQLSSTFGRSSLSGKFDIGITTTEQLEVGFDIRSTLLSYFDAEASAEQDADSSQKNIEPLFTNETIDWSWLSKFKLAGQAQIDELEYEKSKFQKLDFTITNDDQGFNISSLKSELNSGKLEAAIQIQAKEDGVNIKSELSFSDVDMSKSGLFEEGEIKGGLSSGRFNIESSGRSTQDLAANSNGSLLIDIGEGEIAQGSMDVLGSDLILSTLSKLNPFSKSDPSTKLECAVINLNIDDGIIRSKNSIAMETSKVAIVGTGKINLNNETLDLKLNPKPKKSLGVNLSSLAKAVKLGGSLSKPTPEISALGIAETGLSVGAAVSTGGLSLLAEGLIDDVTAGQACNNARRAFDNQNEESAPLSGEQEFSQQKPQIELKEIELPVRTTRENTGN